MTLKNTLVFGLDVNVSLADVLNRTECLTNLNLDIRDLELIRGLGSSGASATSSDFQSISNLSRPVTRSFDRYTKDTNLYLDILSDTGGADSQMRGNLDIAGGIAGSAIRFKFLQGKLTANTDAFAKFGDISTSRVSSWSSLQVGSQPADTDPILFGGNVEVEGGITTGKLKSRTVATLREFDSEVPTHKIKLNVNGVTRYAYAMKGIPLVFRGFFRNADIDIRLSSYVANDSRVSYKIRPTDGTTVEKFEDVGSLRSFLQYRSPFAKERDIEVYYDPRNINYISMKRIGLRNLPSIKIPSLLTLNVEVNNFREFPDLNFFCENVRTLDVSNNSFYLSSIVNERKFNNNILSKLPSTITSIDLRGCFRGSIAFTDNKDLAEALPALRSISIDRSGSLRFYPDSDSTGQDGGLELPLVAESVTSYNAASNDFRRFPANNGVGRSIKTLPSLTSFNVYGNRSLVDDAFTLSTSVINYINIGATKVSIPSLQNQTNLSRIYFQYNRNTSINSTMFIPGVNNISGYKFINCGNLDLIYGYNSSVSGYIPRFQGNKKLRRIDFRYMNSLTGGRPDKSTTPGDTNYKILYNDTFQDTILQYIYIIVNNVNFTGGLEPDCLQTITATLYYFYFISYGRCGGSFPNTSGLGNLRYCRAQYNGFTGQLPALGSSPNIYYIDLSTNEFTGDISYNGRNNLQFILLNSNNLTGFSNVFGALPKLRYLYCSSNEFSGQIPNLSTQCPNLERFLSTNNNPGFSSYQVGSFESLPKLRILDLSNNNLSSTDIDNILYDLVKNYQAANRPGVSVNLLGNNAPSFSNDPEIYTGAQAKSILQELGWVIQTDT